MYFDFDVLGEAQFQEQALILRETLRLLGNSELDVWMNLHIYICNVNALLVLLWLYLLLLPY